MKTLLILLSLLIAIPTATAQTTCEQRVQTYKRRLKVIKRKKKLCERKLENCLDPQPDPTPDPLPTLIQCTKRSWKNGDLWKPVSDSNGLPVLLLSTSLPDQDHCTAQRKEGVDILAYKGKANGDRQTYRADAPCETYKPNGTVRCHKENTCIEWKLATDPCQRLE